MAVIMITFNLKDYHNTLSFEAHEMSWKDDLLLIADHFEIQILRSVKKSKIMQHIFEHLLMEVLTVLPAVKSTSGLVEISTNNSWALH